MKWREDDKTIGEHLNLKHMALMCLLLGLLFFRPLLPSKVVEAVFLPTIILSAWLAGGKSRLSFILLILFGLLAAGVLFFDIWAHQEFRNFFRTSKGFVVGIAILMLLVYCGVVILHSLLTVERVFINEIIGTFNIYLVMGFTWAYIYGLVELSSPGSFQFPESGAIESVGMRFFYFSFITLTTVGFGDTVPIRPTAEMLVILEAIIGQFYVAVVVAYLVSMYITHKLIADGNSE